MSKYLLVKYRTRLNHEKSEIVLMSEFPEWNPITLDVVLDVKELEDKQLDEDLIESIWSVSYRDKTSEFNYRIISDAITDSFIVQERTSLNTWVDRSEELPSLKAAVRGLKKWKKEVITLRDPHMTEREMDIRRRNAK